MSESVDMEADGRNNVVRYSKESVKVGHFRGLQRGEIAT